MSVETFLLIATVEGDSITFEARPNDGSNRKFYLPNQPIEDAVAKVEGLIAPGYQWKLDELLKLRAPGKAIQGYLNCSIDVLLAAGFDAGK